MREWGGREGRTEGGMNGEREREGREEGGTKGEGGGWKRKRLSGSVGFFLHVRLL